VNQNQPGTAATVPEGDANDLSGKEWKTAALGSELGGSSPQPPHSELNGSPQNSHPELHGSGGGSPNTGTPNSPYSPIHEAGAGAVRPELQGSGQQQHVVSPVSQQGGDAHEMSAYPMSATMNSPVYEMPTEYGREH
jgi:hypothetical protein